MKAVVFLGPSCPDIVHDDPLVSIRPPAAAGDLYRAARQGFDLIGLMDRGHDWARGHSECEVLADLWSRSVLAACLMSDVWPLLQAFLSVLSFLVAVLIDACYFNLKNKKKIQ